MGTAVVLATAAGFGNHLLIASYDARVAVLVLARTVEWGHRIVEADLAVAHIVQDPAAQMIRAEEQAAVIGKTAVTTLTTGSVLAPKQISDTPVPGAGQHLLGLGSKPGLPARGLRPGERVLVTPVVSGQTGAVETALRGAGFPARVFGIGGEPAQGTVTVDVVIATEHLDKATAAAAGPVIITVLGPGN
ncbi:MULTISPECIES: SAF domain-containing protein [unclassified Crossiella]|uniref:SAF domain-containing protein n=1 Tax=unclassified Crossiella TaxID=2620835 RepID=UPI001FFF5E12|nr:MULTISPECIES: SAF domain-containing protein [unclassified Crossiella]MCK2241869.1 hypothetical protein [Crossiella sp. S99.2]MCK2255772.1 hypothetical protein [Crossiella sp. S99.1]